MVDSEPCPVSLKRAPGDVTSSIFFKPFEGALQCSIWRRATHATSRVCTLHWSLARTKPKPFRAAPRNSDGRESEHGLR